MTPQTAGATSGLSAEPTSVLGLKREAGSEPLSEERGKLQAPRERKEAALLLPQHVRPRNTRGVARRAVRRGEGRRRGRQPREEHVVSTTEIWPRWRSGYEGLPAPSKTSDCLVETTQQP